MGTNPVYKHCCCPVTLEKADGLYQITVNDKEVIHHQIICFDHFGLPNDLFPQTLLQYALCIALAKHIMPYLLCSRPVIFKRFTRIICLLIRFDTLQENTPTQCVYLISLCLYYQTITIMIVLNKTS